MFKIAILTLLSILIFINDVNAGEVNNTIHSSVIITKPKLTLNSTISERKEVVLMDLKLTPLQQRIVLKYQPSANKNKIGTDGVPLPSKALIGMNGVPVLDQGKYGSCVTFANTAAIDVLLGKGDYISQVCHLELGVYLQNKAVKILSPSGWWGSSGRFVLQQISSFGFINKENQRTKSCACVTQYPSDQQNSVTEIPMSLDEFQSMREDLMFGPVMVKWDSLLTSTERFNFNPANPFPPYDGDKILLEVKQFIASVVAKSKNNPIGIVTFGVMLPYTFCSAGACAEYKAKEDTWAITKAIANIDPETEWLKLKLAGHEMIITGYDDEAIAVDNEGNKHQGLLFLRNSFGDEIGDHGNNYMTYDFFKKFANEVQIIYQPDYSILTNQTEERK